MSTGIRPTTNSTQKHIAFTIANTLDNVVADPMYRYGKEARGLEARMFDTICTVCVG